MSEKGEISFQLNYPCRRMKRWRKNGTGQVE
jgi:hypothetical protein